MSKVKNFLVVFEEFYISLIVFRMFVSLPGTLL